MYLPESEKTLCAATGPLLQHSKITVKSVKSPGLMNIIGMNFLKVDKCSDAFEYILVISDHFTKYKRIYSTKNN